MTPDPLAASRFEQQSALRAGARGIATGLPLNWQSLESLATDDADRDVLRQLHVLAQIADVYRDADDSANTSIWDTVSQVAADDGRIADDRSSGPRWGSLVLLERLGAGAFGEVFRAWDDRLDREVALKLLRPVDPKAAGSRTTVIEEARLLARLSHPNVVTIYGADQMDGRVGLWMELVRGRTLEHALLQDGPFSPEEAAAAGLAICRALSAVHGARLIHRDVKAQNVMRGVGGRIVLMDFGTGHELADDTSHAGVSGTPLYLAPEVFRKEPITPKSDLYSLGVLLYHLVTGKYPVNGATAMELADAHRDGRRVHLRDVRPDLPALFVGVIERALSPDPARRYDTAGSMEHALVEALVDAPSVHPAHAQRDRPAPLARGGVYGPARIAGGVLLVGLFALAVWAAKGRSAPISQPAADPKPTSLAPPGPVTMEVTGMQKWRYLGRPSASGHIPFFDVEGDLAVRIGTGEIRKLTDKGNIDEGGELAAAVSSDGDRVAYTWRTLSNAYEMRLINMDGKWPRVLLRDTELRGIPKPLQWSSDSKAILILVERPDRTSEFAMVDAAKGSVRPLKNIGHRQPLAAALSADGKFVAFDYPQELNSSSRDIAVMSTQGAFTESPVVKHPGSDMFPMWTADGRSLLFFSNRTGALGAWLQPVVDGRPAGEPRVVDKAVGRIVPSGLNAAGTLFYEKATGMSDVYLATMTSSGVEEARVVGPNFVGESSSSDFSPDGRRVAWVSLRGAMPFDRHSRSLIIQDLADRTEVELRPALTFYNGLRWSPDSRSIMVRGADFEQRQGWHVVDARTRNTRPVLVGSDDVIGNAIWSADGQAIIYGRRNSAIVSRNLKSGNERVLVDVSSEGFLGRGVSQTFGLSPDGTALAYRLNQPQGGVTGQPGDATLRVKFLNGETRDLLAVGPTEGIIFQDWTADGRGVLVTRFLQADRGTRTLWLVPLDGAPARSLGLTLADLSDVQVRPGGGLITFSAGIGTWALWQTERFLGRN